MGSWRVWQWFRRVFRIETPRSLPPSGRQTSASGRPGGQSRQDAVRSPATPASTSPSPRATAPPRGKSSEAIPQRPQSPSARRDTIDLVIGLDFGTAATKVVIRSPYLPGQRAAAVNFGELGHPAWPYLLPSHLRIGSDGHLSIRGDKGGEWLTDLKLPLLDRSASSDDTSDTDDRVRAPVAYLALTLREARARFLTAERETYGRFDPRWALNLGIPSAGYDDNAIRRRFLRAARAAWVLSCESESLTWDSIAEALYQERQPTFDPRTAITVVPEVAAQAVGYARSTLRDPGLHLLIDVGAGTLDVCGFVLHERQGQDRYALLTTTVDRLGVLELHRQRLAALRCPTRTDGSNVTSHDLLMPISETLADYHPGCSCSPPDIDAQFSGQATRIVMSHLMDLRQHRDPLSRRWDTGLPVFLCGGGSGMRLFRQLVQQADRRFRFATTAKGLSLRTLPRPEHLLNEDIGDALFHRLSVAYGLSFDALNIGEVSPPHRSPDLPPPRRRDHGEDFISKDQV